MRDARRRLIGALLLALIAGDALAMRPLPLFRASERGALGGDLSALALDALLQQRSLMLDESLLELAGGVDLEELLGSSAAAVDAGGLHKWEYKKVFSPKNSHMELSLTISFTKKKALAASASAGVSLGSDVEAGVRFKATFGESAFGRKKAAEATEKAASEIKTAVLKLEGGGKATVNGITVYVTPNMKLLEASVSPKDWKDEEKRLKVALVAVGLDVKADPTQWFRNNYRKEFPKDVSVDVTGKATVKLEPKDVVKILEANAKMLEAEKAVVRAAETAKKLKDLRGQIKALEALRKGTKDAKEAARITREISELWKQQKALDKVLREEEKLAKAAAKAATEAAEQAGKTKGIRGFLAKTIGKQLIKFRSGRIAKFAGKFVPYLNIALLLWDVYTIVKMIVDVGSGKNLKLGPGADAEAAGAGPPGEGEERPCSDDKGLCFDPYTTICKGEVGEKTTVAPATSPAPPPWPYLCRGVNVCCRSKTFGGSVPCQANGQTGKCFHVMMHQCSSRPAAGVCKGGYSYGCCTGELTPLNLVPPGEKGPGDGGPKPGAGSGGAGGAGGASSGSGSGSGAASDGAGGANGGTSGSGGAEGASGGTDENVVTEPDPFARPAAPVDASALEGRAKELYDALQAGGSLALNKEQLQLFQELTTSADLSDDSVRQLKEWLSNPGDRQYTAADFMGYLYIMIWRLENGKPIDGSKDFEGSYAEEPSSGPEPDETLPPDNEPLPDYGEGSSSSGGGGAARPSQQTSAGGAGGAGSAGGAGGSGGSEPGPSAVGSMSLGGGTGGSLSGEAVKSTSEEPSDAAKGGSGASSAPSGSGAGGSGAGDGTGDGAGSGTGDGNGGTSAGGDGSGGLGGGDGVPRSEEKIEKDNKSKCPEKRFACVVDPWPFVDGGTNGPWSVKQSAVDALKGKTAQTTNGVFEIKVVDAKAGIVDNEVEGHSDKKVQHFSIQLRVQVVKVLKPSPQVKLKDGDEFDEPADTWWMLSGDKPQFGRMSQTPPNHSALHKYLYVEKGELKMKKVSVPLNFGIITGIPMRLLGKANADDPKKYRYVVIVQMKQNNDPSSKGVVLGDKAYLFAKDALIPLLGDYTAK